MDDDGLIAAVAAGDDVALRALFDRHAPWMAARLRTVLPAPDVEDVLQESFLAVWRGACNYRPQGSPGGWLWGVTRRQAALWLRRRSPSTVPLLGLPEIATDPGNDLADATLVRLELADAVESLGPQGSATRELWRLMYVEDRTVAEVAGLLGVPEGTVKSRAFRVRQLMRAVLMQPAKDGGGQ